MTLNGFLPDLTPGRLANLDVPEAESRLQVLLSDFEFRDVFPEYAPSICDLVRRGLDPELTSEGGPHLLQVAAESGTTALVRLLLDKGASVARNGIWGETALHAASDGEIAELLIAAGASVNVPSQPAESGYIQGGLTPLHTACRRNSPEVAALLLEHGADPGARNAAGKTPLFFGGAEIAEQLLAAGAKASNHDNEENIALFSARSVPKMRVLLDALRSPDWRNERGENALFHHSEPELVAYLLANGASPHARESSSGRTPIFRLECDLEFLRMLLEAGAHVNARDDNLQTPLMLAADCDFIEAIELLIEYGADVNAEDREGRTALFAWNMLDPATSALLVRHGAALDHHDSAGRTPLFCAESRAQAANLVKLGADIGTVRERIAEELSRISTRDTMRSATLYRERQ